MKKLVLGTVQLGLDYGINNKKGKPSLEEAYSILDMAYQNDISILDTAAAYGDSEEIIGKYMKDTNRRFKIATKLKPLKKHKNIESIIESEIKDSLRRLNVSSIDYYYLHNFKDVFENPSILNILDRFKDKGLIKKAGISIYDTEELDYIINNLSGLIDIVQIPFNIFDLRWINSGLLDKAKKTGLMIFARSIYLQGLIFCDKETADKIHPKLYGHITKLQKFCEVNNISLDQAAMGFAKQQGEIDYIIIGCDTQEHIINGVKNFNSQKIELEKKLYNFAFDNFKNIDKVIIDPRLWAKV
ncbi:aldo/keto reductase [Paramaledivibacter caminithermalis]|jgi:aryl-alcohol dehydrogenase-like predicted oxidoreductase|uniref:Predicted oxidoreductase n=1 Tax=Paramaledivibacter caminithermalis (strain DSM 15212 / CIP 107654 / DViRD3) TaxID=1121301 RepID=A0A1M6L6V7_PARC5|nr:aldo/keto reductase [Paramaledivibacter caminithermalis]SHJ66926.1 Predicted oxidoreductase [Paramaledivibacter caminithermalis DSM 15212]